MAEREYERLTRSGPRSAYEFIRIARASLWLGKDHLLCLETSGYSYTESYKRFYFRDIQTIIIQKNSARNVRSLIYGGLTMLLLIIGLAAADSVAGRVIYLSVAGIFLIAAVINFLLGPMCVCQVRTAVQTESLPLIRVRRAQKFVERMRPLIAAAQGQLTSEEITTRMRQLTAGGSALVQAPAPAQTATPAQTSSPAPEASPSATEDSNAPPRAVT